MRRFFSGAPPTSSGFLPPTPVAQPRALWERQRIAQAAGLTPGIRLGRVGPARRLTWMQNEGLPAGPTPSLCGDSLQGLQGRPESLPEPARKVPMSPKHHGLELVEGDVVAVLGHYDASSLLRRHLWARDALDTAAAVTRDRTALAEAASSFALADLKRATSCWRSSTGARAIAMNAEPLLQNESGIDPARIGSEAAEAAINHRYRRIVIERSGDEVVIRRATPAGPLADVACNADDVAQVLRRTGLLAHLDRNGPVSGAELLAALRRHDGADQVSFDSVNEDSVHQVRRAARAAA